MPHLTASAAWRRPTPRPCPSRLPQLPPSTFLVWLSPPPRDARKVEKRELPAEWIRLYDRVAQVGLAAGAARCSGVGCGWSLAVAACCAPQRGGPPCGQARLSACLLQPCDMRAAAALPRGCACRTWASTAPTAPPSTWTSSASAWVRCRCCLRCWGAHACMHARPPMMLMWNAGVMHGRLERHWLPRHAWVGRSCCGLLAALCRSCLRASLPPGPAPDRPSPRRALTPADCLAWCTIADGIHVRDSVNAVLVQQLVNAYLLHVRGGTGRVARQIKCRGGRPARGGGRGGRTAALHQPAAGRRQARLTLVCLALQPGCSWHPPRGRAALHYGLVLPCWTGGRPAVCLNGSIHCRASVKRGR